MISTVWAIEAMESASGTPGDAGPLAAAKPLVGSNEPIVRISVMPNVRPMRTVERPRSPLLFSFIIEYLLILIVDDKPETTLGLFYLGQASPVWTCLAKSILPFMFRWQGVSEHLAEGCLQANSTKQWSLLGG
jgi:hypothetical protein